MGLYFANKCIEGLVCFADAGYLSDPHNGRSQMRYILMCGGASISWRSMKQTIAATSSNHAKILAVHEANRERVWLRNMTHHIRKVCNLFSEKEAPTVIHEDNAACITQLKDGYIKGDRVKHISLKFFFTHDLQKDGIMMVQQIRSSGNLADLFTKALSTSVFKKLAHGIGLRRLKDIK